MLPKSVRVAFDLNDHGVMQEPLLCRMSVRRNVTLGLRFRRLPRSEVEGRADEWLKNSWARDPTKLDVAWVYRMEPR